MDRRDYPPSPPGHGYYHNRDAHYRDLDRRRGGDPDDGYRRHHHHARSRRDDRDGRDYQSMYDDDASYQDDRSHRHSRGQYRDEDRHYEDRRYSRRDDAHDGNRSRSLPRDAGRPTDTVKVEGLPLGVSNVEVCFWPGPSPAHATNANSVQLRESLMAGSIAAEHPPVDVRVVSSKGRARPHRGVHRATNPRRGYCRAFLQFPQVDDAVAFVKEHYPRLRISLRPTEEVPDGKYELYLHFARSQGDMDQQGPPSATTTDWTCPQVRTSSRPRASRMLTSPAVQFP